jgi:AP-3 complex subunit delta
VALLAFNKIVLTHPFLVAQQEDVILECIDSPDITIRIKALDLVQGMVSNENLVSVVSRLMKQLKSSAPNRDRQYPDTPENATADADSDEEAQTNIRSPTKPRDQAPPLPDDYVIDVIGRILRMCSQNNYNSIVDFDWYIDVLIQLVRIAPAGRGNGNDTSASTFTKSTATGVSEKIGNELRNVAVKVKAMRGTAVRAAELMIVRFNTDTPPGHSIVSGSLKPISWIVGEYAVQLAVAEDSLASLLQLLPRAGSPEIMTAGLEACTKVFAFIGGDVHRPWTAERKSQISLLMARIIHVLEPLALHPNLEVQERAVEFTELLKLTAEAASGQAVSTDTLHQDPPLLLTQAIPSLFSGWELNSVAPGAQSSVPIPDGLDLDAPIHPNLNALLSDAHEIPLESNEADEFEIYYHQRPAPTSVSSSEPAINRLADAPEESVSSYQQESEESYLDADIVARRKAERLERTRDDPYYIGGASDTQRISTPIHNILQRENGPDLDIDSIPIMQLDLGNLGSSSALSPKRPTRPLPSPRQKVVIAADETLGGSGGSTPRNYESENNLDSFTKTKSKKLKQSLLKVDSSNIGLLSLEGAGPVDLERQQQEDAEMAKAMKEVEKLRLEMQRANERIQVAQGVDVEGTVIKKKKVKKPVAKDASGNVVKTKKKKTKPAGADGEAGPSGEAATPVNAEDDAVVPKRKKKKPKPLVQVQEAE